MSGVPKEWQKEIQKALNEWRKAVFVQDVTGVLKDPRTQKITSLEGQTTETLSPVTQPSLLYPSIYGVRPRKKDFICPRCSSTGRSRLISVFMASEQEKLYSFLCQWCNKKWAVSARLVLNEILEDQINRIAGFTKKTGREFGALIFRTSRGIVLDLMQIGEPRSVSLKLTRKLQKDEEVLGTYHQHPISDRPSYWDIATFLKDSWEKISCVNGSKGTLTVMIKDENTLGLKSDEDIEKWEKEKTKNETSLTEISNEHKFLIYRGKPRNLSLLGDSGQRTTSLEKIVSGVKGLKELA
jgi:proteasome lid subunit RPN8/RPN11